MLKKIYASFGIAALMVMTLLMTGHAKRLTNFFMTAFIKTACHGGEVKRLTGGCASSAAAHGGEKIKSNDSKG